MPQISVIVPVYRVEKYIHRCVDSILNQTFTDFELILVDDGSPDNCGAICDEYAAKDSRVRVIHQANGGLSAARNAGIDWVFANSDSQWLTFIDSDDWVHPEYLERLLNAALENHVAVSVCGYVTTEGEKPDLSDADTPPQIWNPEDFYVEHRTNAIIACAKLYRKECFEAIRFPDGKLHEDEFTTYKILFSFGSVAVEPSSLYFYFMNSDGIIRITWTPARMAALEALEEQLVFYRRNGHEKAYECTADVVIQMACLMIRKIDDSAGNYQEFRKQLLRKLRTYIRRYKKRLDISIVNYCYALEMAYPIRMKLYWYWKAFCRKLGIKV